MDDERTPMSSWDTSWEVKDWRELKRLENGERLFEVVLLGIDLPALHEELVPLRKRAEGAEETGPVTDFCQCGHTRGSHERDDAHACLMHGCDCNAFRLLAAGVEGVEEMPPAPRQGEVLPEEDALQFLEELREESGMPFHDAKTLMALQRLVSSGWRLVPPKSEDSQPWP